MTSMKQDFEKFKIFFNISVLLVTFSISSHYPKIDSSYWLKETFSGSRISFSEKTLGFQMASTFSSRTSLVNFRFLPDFVVVFIVIRLVVMNILILPLKHI